MGPWDLGWDEDGVFYVRGRFTPEEVEAIKRAHPEYEVTEVEDEPA
jgi:hypothetical protein